MRTPKARFLLPTLLLAAAGTVAAQQAPTPPPQSVVVPSMPDQKNKEGTVKPEQALPTDSEGYAQTKRYDPNAPPAQPAGGASSAGAPAGAKSASPPPPSGSTTPLPVGPAPTSKGVTTGANYLNIRGTVTTFDPGKAVTIKIQRTGATVTYTLAEKAAVPKDLKQGELVRVRVNALEKGRVVDRVERIKTTPAPPPPAPPAT